MQSAKAAIQSAAAPLSLGSFMKRLFLCLLLLASGLAHPALAYGPDGHKIIGAMTTKRCLAALEKALAPNESTPSPATAAPAPR